MTRPGTSTTHFLPVTLTAPMQPPLYVILRPVAGGWEYIGDGPFLRLDEAAEAVIGEGEFTARDATTGADVTADVERRASRIENEIFAETRAQDALRTGLRAL